MKIKAIRIKNNLSISDRYEREVKASIIILALFCASMIIGAGVFRINNTDTFDNIFNVLIKTKSDTTTIKLFINSLLINGILLFITFFCGLSCLGLPVISVIPVLQGLGYGMIAGFLIKNYSYNGMGYDLLTVFPEGLITVTITVLSCCTAVISTFDTLSVTLAKQPADANRIIHYIKKYLILLVITIISALVDSLFTKAFSHLFIF